MAKTTKRDLIVATWEILGCPVVDAKLLRRIRNVLRKEFSDPAVDSPAAIARVLADGGAFLKHPEIIEFDARWRETRIRREAKRFKPLEQFSSGPLTLKQADLLIKELENLRQQFTANGDEESLTRLVTLAADARRAAQTAAKRSIADPALRAEQSEIAEWLKVWLQTPALFTDWVELRKGSDEFRSKFASEP